jgi:uncharacterized RDD family membrane protein YckC
LSPREAPPAADPDIEVVSADDGDLSFAQVMGRSAAYVLDVMTIYVGFMMAGFGPSYRALHDRVSGAVVVKRTHHWSI